MKNKMTLLAVAAATFILLYGANQVYRHYQGGKTPSLCLLAGESFILKSRDAMILTDGPFREGYPEDQPMSQEAIDKIMTAEPPFDGVDLVTISHKHIDHFDAEALMAILSRLPETRVLMPLEAYEEFKKVNGAEMFEGQIVAKTPERGAPETVTVNGIEVQVYNLDHSTEVENIGVLFTLGGKTFFHMGDYAAADFAGNAIKDLHVDYLLVPYWYLRNDTNFALLKENMSWNYVVPMHIPRPDMPQEMIDRIGTWDELMETMKAMDPNVLLLNQEGACAQAVD